MTIIALAGRRIDATDAPVARFPLTAAPRVREQIATLFHKVGATAVVGSCACGADLLALDVAGEAKLPRTIILPYNRKRFRRESVMDRPGEWGEMFDRIILEVAAQRTLKTLGTTHDLLRDFARANELIFKIATQQAQLLNGRFPHPLMTVLIWDGVSRGTDDMTAAFKDKAIACHIPVHEIYTNR